MYQIVWDGAASLHLLIPICLTVAVLACICGCRGRDRKDELVGVEGHVKIHNSDIIECEVNGNNIEDRASNTAQRSLPDLPVDNPVTWDPGDSASELYATVGGKTLPQPAEANSSGIKSPSSHGYDQLRGVEHAYAQVMADVQEAPREPAPSNQIAAAPAVAGHVHASDDLPYMTPPAHFSGDSQDSSKGYTSISVREPLSQLRAETVDRPQERHYATVSDDSDDMYAAIDEPASGSETYAKIRQEISVPPTVSHARQESSSSAGSAGLMSSPKPEKREANSPLPAPPPDGLPRNLDDMYAKVNKKKRRELDEQLDRGNSTESAMSGSSECVSYRLQSNTSITDSSMSCPSQTTTTDSTTHTTHSCPSHNTTESPSSQRPDVSDSSLSSDIEILDPRYEVLPTNSGYSSLDAVASNSCFPNMHNGDRLCSSDKSVHEPNYETLDKGPPSDSDPNYETLNKGPPSDSDPNYERIGQNAIVDGYATVFHRPDPPYATLDSEPPYSSLHPNCDPPYSSLDPPYSVLRPRSTEPPYSTFGNNTEPPYQLLANCESGAADK